MNTSKTNTIYVQSDNNDDDTQSDWDEFDSLNPPSSSSTMNSIQALFPVKIIFEKIIYQKNSFTTHPENIFA